jgi:hypothetical protein
MHEVIGVHARDELASTVLHAGIQGGDDPPMRGRNHLKARILVSKPLSARA